MPRVKQPKGARGSLKWIQKLVNDKPELKRDDYAEYSDGAFLRTVGVDQECAQQTHTLLHGARLLRFCTRRWACAASYRGST